MITRNMFYEKGQKVTVNVDWELTDNAETLTPYIQADLRPTENINQGLSITQPWKRSYADAELEALGYWDSVEKQYGGSYSFT